MARNRAQRRGAKGSGKRVDAAIERDEARLAQRGRSEVDLIWPQGLRLLRDLGHSAAWWIGATNRIANLETWALPTADHVLQLLHRYLDVKEGEESTRQEEFERIAGEISGAMEGARHTFSPNTAFEPNRGGTGEALEDWATPFRFDDEPAGTAALYESLARFLASPFASRLDRCRYCGGLFISLTNHRRKYCPLTDHQDRMARKRQADRRKTQEWRDYMRDKMREYRSQDHPKRRRYAD